MEKIETVYWADFPLPEGWAFKCEHGRSVTFIELLPLSSIFTLNKDALTRYLKVPIYKACNGTLYIKGIFIAKYYKYSKRIVMYKLQPTKEQLRETENIRTEYLLSHADI